MPQGTKQESENSDKPVKSYINNAESKEQHTCNGICIYTSSDKSSASVPLASVNHKISESRFAEASKGARDLG